MSSIETRPANPTELRLDYNDLVAGQLVIVIHGVPTPHHDAPTPAAIEPSAGSSSRTRYGRNHGSALSPLIEEANAIVEAIGYAAPALFTPLLLAAWKGKEALTLDLVAATNESAPAEDATLATALTEYAKSVLYNGLGRYEDALAAAQDACSYGDPNLSSWAQLELVEASARTSDARAAAIDALRDLDERGRTRSTDWALGVWARSAALLSSGSAAEALYRDAIDRFARNKVALHLSRAQLVFGEWLRRENRRVEAREQLRAAHETLSKTEVEAYAARASRELLATGETARRRTDDTRDALTAQEAQIARLAREGLSNPEIGLQLFISPRTVQYHLRKVFRKLDINSRNHLSRVPAGRLGAA